MLKKILLGGLAVLLLVAVGGGIFVWTHVRAYDESTAKSYDIPLPSITVSSDPAVLERGKHLAEALGGCTACHGDNLAGGKEEKMGPIGRMVMPNITRGQGARGTSYSDAELARLLTHGVRKDGTTVRMMPVHEMAWWPDEDVVAVISYLRSLPPVDGDPGLIDFSPIAKVLDRMDAIPLDIARRIDHQNPHKAPPASVSAEYGAFVALSCTGCHGKKLSGGPIPGGPPDFVPLNLTSHPTGLGDYSFADFEKVLREGVRKNGQKVNAYMPIAATKNYNDTEMRALWEFLRAQPAVAFGNR